MCLGFGLVLSVIALSVCNGYDWYEPYHGSETGACPGDNVTFPWSFHLYGREQLNDLEWYFVAPDGSEELIGTYFHDRFIPSSSTRQRLSFNINEGLTLSGVTQADYGSYYVHMVVNSDGYLTAETRNVYIQPPRSPDIRNQELVARILPAIDYGGGDWRVQLGCGYFYSTGDQSSTMIWKTPSSRITTEATFQNGEFVLTLENPVQEGIYSCQLLSNNNMTGWCARTNPALDFHASVHVDYSAVQFAILNGRLNAMQQELNYLRYSGRCMTLINFTLNNNYENPFIYTYINTIAYPFAIPDHCISTHQRNSLIPTYSFYIRDLELIINNSDIIILLTMIIYFKHFYSR